MGDLDRGSHALGGQLPVVDRVVVAAGEVLDREPGQPGSHGRAQRLGDAGGVVGEAVLEIGRHREVGGAPRWRRRGDRLVAAPSRRGDRAWRRSHCSSWPAPRSRARPGAWPSPRPRGSAAAAGPGPRAGHESAPTSQRVRPSPECSGASSGPPEDRQEATARRAPPRNAGPCTRSQVGLLDDADLELDADDQHATAATLRRRRHHEDLARAAKATMPVKIGLRTGRRGRR